MTGNWSKSFKNGKESLKKPFGKCCNDPEAGRQSCNLKIIVIQSKLMFVYCRGKLTGPQASNQNTQNDPKIDPSPNNLRIPSIFQREHPMKILQKSTKIP